MFFKKVLSLIIVSAMIFCLCACSDTNVAPAGNTDSQNQAQEGQAQASEGQTAAPAEETVITVFAPEGAVLFLISAVELYGKQRPDVSISVAFDTSTVNAEKVMSGYKCDLLVVDDTQILDFIDASCGPESNPHGLDLIDGSSRTDICSYLDEASGGDIMFTAAVLKKSAYAEETAAFVDFMRSCSSEMYSDYGYTKAE